MTERQCVILAGGLATRLRPVTETLPKSLVPVAGRPFADHQLRWLSGAGITDVVFCIGHLGGQIRHFVGSGERWGLRAAYADEGDELRGTGGALRLALDEGLLQDAFAVLYGDSYLDVRIGEVWEDFEARRPAALMTVFRNDGRYDRSNARLLDGWVVRYDKDVPDPAELGMRHIDYGLSIIDSDEIARAVPAGAVVDLAHVYRRLAEEGRLAGHEVFERFYEVGSPAGLAELDARLAETA